MGNCMSPLENQCQPRLRLGRHWFSRGDNFPCYLLMPSMFIQYSISLTYAQDQKDFKRNSMTFMATHQHKNPCSSSHEICQTLSWSLLLYILFVWSQLQNCSSPHTRQASADSYLITPRPCDVKRHCTGLFLGLIQKKMAVPISMLTSSTIDGCDFYNPLQFIEIEVNTCSIKGKICTVLN